MKEDSYTLKSGMLDVGGGHSIYYQDWGNPKALTPIFFLHGGPGSGSKDRYKLPFDPKLHRVIFHDQRGCGLSTPLGSLAHNTTQDLIEDINKLRRFLNIEQLSLWGGSWGSTLALTYAIDNPHIVKKMLLNGIYLGRKEDNDFIYYHVSSHFPDLHERFLSVVPPKHQKDVVGYYKTQITSPDPAIRNKYVREWSLYEWALMSLDANIGMFVQEAQSEEEPDWVGALLETHYFSNNNFLPENYILKNADKIKNIPTVIVHGRYDFVCPPTGAFALKEAFGENAILQVVEGGHNRSEPTMREAIKAYTNVFL